jgi:hypothetical protein
LNLTCGLAIVLEGFTKNENVVAAKEGIPVDSAGVEINVGVGAIGLVG